MNQPDVNHWNEVAERVAIETLATTAKDVDLEGRWPAESIEAIRRAGLLGLVVAAEFGGAGQPPAAFAAVTRILARHCASTAMIYLMHVCGTQVIAAAPDLEGKADILRAIAEGKHLSTLAFSEKGSRSHFWAPVSQAQVAGETHILSAEKSWVTSAGHADSYIVSSRAAGQSQPLANTIYYVPRDRNGLTVNGPWNGLGLRGNASAPMRLEKVSVPGSYRVSPEGKGFDCMVNTVLPWFQLGSAAVAVGIARAATEATRGHLLASKLEHLGESLASLMNLRARLAQMQIQVDTQEAFGDRVAHLMANPGPDTMLAVLESKAAAAEMALQVTDQAMRSCGGAAFSRHLTVERNFRDARAGWVMAPTTDVLHDLVGRLLLDMPLF